MALQVISRRRHYFFNLPILPHMIKFVSTILYKPPVEISPNLQLRCTWGQWLTWLHFEISKQCQCHREILQQRRNERQFVVKDHLHHVHIKKGPLTCCNFYRYRRIFVIFLCTTSQENANVVMEEFPSMHSFCGYWTV